MLYRKFICIVVEGLGSACLQLVGTKPNACFFAHILSLIFHQWCRSPLQQPSNGKCCGCSGAKLKFSSVRGEGGLQDTQGCTTQVAPR